MAGRFPIAGARIAYCCHGAICAVLVRLRTDAEFGCFSELVFFVIGVFRGVLWAGFWGFEIGFDGFLTACATALLD